MEVTHVKKAYSLDYSIERDCDRVTAVKDILDQLPSDPNSSDLEQMADYILYGKDEEGRNAVQRGETTNSNTRYNSFKTANDKLQSLDAIIENPLSDQQQLQTQLKRDVYLKKTRTISRKDDADIPFMSQVWDSIDRLDRWIHVIEGKLAPQPGDVLFDDSYHLYQLKHILIDLRRHQYYLKDYYKPIIQFQAVDHPHAQFYDWTADAFYWMPYAAWKERVDNALLHSISKNIEDYETRGEGPNLEVKWVVRRHTFDWENPAHVRALINNWELMYESMRDRLDTYGYTLLLDFERYHRMANLTPVREFLLQQKMVRASYASIISELKARFGLSYNENHLSTILSKEIPQKIADAAQRHRLILETPREEKKKCARCGQFLPRSNLFFACNRSRKDGFSSSCKECERKMRIMRGGQTQYDKRSKEASMLEMQAAKAGN